MPIWLLVLLVAMAIGFPPLGVILIIFAVIVCVAMMVFNNILASIVNCGKGKD